MHDVYSIEFRHTISLASDFPYVPQLSKNQKEIYTKKFTKRKIKNPAHESIKNAITLRFQSLNAKTNNIISEKKPTLVVIKVYRKTRSSDAHNFAEGICDALEKALGINDRYFSVYSVPLIDKENPRIRIEVYQ